MLQFRLLGAQLGSAREGFENRERRFDMIGTENATIFDQEEYWSEFPQKEILRV